MTSVVENKIADLESRKTELVKNIQTRENELKQLYANLNAFNGAIAAMQELKDEANKECESTYSKEVERSTTDEVVATEVEETK